MNSKPKYPLVINEDKFVGNLTNFLKATSNFINYASSETSPPQPSRRMMIQQLKMNIYQKQLELSRLVSEEQRQNLLEQVRFKIAAKQNELAYLTDKVKSMEESDDDLSDELDVTELNSPVQKYGQFPAVPNLTRAVPRGVTKTQAYFRKRVKVEHLHPSRFNQQGRLIQGSAEAAARSSSRLPAAQNQIPTTTRSRCSANRSVEKNQSHF